MTRQYPPWYAQARDLRDSGMPIADIARKLHKSHYQIVYALGENGVRDRAAAASRAHRETKKAKSAMPAPNASRPIAGEQAPRANSRPRSWPTTRRKSRSAR